MSRIGIAVSGGPNPADIVDLVVLAESLGYESAWVAEGHGGDQFAILAACAMRTSRILLGTSISSVFVRTAPTIAMAASAIADLSGGRFILGLGPAVTAGHRFRIGWFTAIGDEGATPEVAASVAAAVHGLAGANCEVAPVSAPFDLGALRTLHATLTAAAAARIVVRFPDRWRAETCDNVRAAAERGLAISATAYVEALDALAAWRADVTAAWGDYDALILPAAAAPAWRAEDEAPPGLTPATQGMFGAWINAAGLPGISVPGQPHPDGRPIGVQIVAPFGHDAVVLEIAERLETLAPWAERWPALASTV